MTRDEIVNRIVELSAAIVICPDSELLTTERAALKHRLGQIDDDAAERRRDIIEAWRETPQHEEERT